MGHANVEQCSTALEATFGLAAGLGAWGDQRLLVGSFRPRPERKTHPDRTVVSRLNDRRDHRAGSKYGSGFDASFYLDGLPTGLVTAGAYSHPQTSLARILRACMGGQRGGAGSTTIAGVSTTAIDVQVGHGARFTAGGACVIAYGGRYYMREVLGVAGDTVNLRMALPGAPGPGVNVLNAATFYIVPASVGGSGDSLAFRFLGEDTEDYWLYRGCAGTFTIETATDEQLVLALSARAADWDRDDSIGPVASGTHVGGGPLDWRWGEVQLGTPGSTAIKVFRFSEVSLNPGLSLLEDRGPEGVETVRRWYGGPTRPTLDLTAHMMVETDWETYQDEYDPTTGDGVRQQHWAMLTAGEPIIGGNGTGMVGLSLPRLMHRAMPERIAGDDGFVDVRYAFDGDEDENAGAAATDLERSIFRVHLA